VRLRDKVQVWTSIGGQAVTLPAAVKYRTFEERVESDLAIGTITVDEMIVLIPAGKVDGESITRVDWRGQSYRTLGLVQVFQRNGRDHHYQIRLRRES